MAGQIIQDELAGAAPAIGGGSAPPSGSGSNDGALARGRFSLAALQQRAERLFGDSARHAGWSLVDQAIVSGTRFATTVVIGRLCGAHELGIYALGFTIVVWTICMQDSLIAAPYTIFTHGLQGQRRAQYAGNALMQSGLLMLLVTIGLCLLGGLFASGVGISEMAPVVWILLAIVPFLLLREFARRYLFAHMRMRGVLLLDASCAAMQLGGLIWLAAVGRLTAPAAFAVIGIASATGAVIWLWSARAELEFDWPSLSQSMRTNWRLGRWVFGSQMVGFVTAYAMFWLLSISVSPAATGAYAACVTLVMLANPLVLGLSNVLGPRLAQGRAEKGRVEVRRLVIKALLGLGIVMVTIASVLVVGGGVLLDLIYGSEYAVYANVVRILALMVVLGSLDIVLEHGVRVLERAELNLVAGIVGLLVALSTAATTMAFGPWGVVAAAWCVTAAAAASLAVRATFLQYLIGRSTRPSKEGA